jgi:hypothetical protein
LTWQGEKESAMTINVSVELDREHAAALLRFLRRVDTRTIEYVLSNADEEIECFEAAAKRMRVGLRKALDGVKS